MKATEKLEKLFSPLDVVILTKEYQFLVPKQVKPDLPDVVKSDIYKYLSCGDWPNRNPSVWTVFGSEQVDTKSERWINGMMNLFRLTCESKISEIDNDTNHVCATVEFTLLAVNAKSIPLEELKEVKCATVRTAFGTFPLEIE